MIVKKEKKTEKKRGRKRKCQISGKQNKNNELNIFQMSRHGGEQGNMIICLLIYTNNIKKNKVMSYD